MSAEAVNGQGGHRCSILQLGFVSNLNPGREGGEFVPIGPVLRCDNAACDLEWAGWVSLRVGPLDWSPVESQEQMARETAEAP